jgi:hypothetical protein
MAVVNVSQWQIKPGRAIDFFSQFPMARAIHERLGGKVRAWQNVAAGPNTGVFSYAIEFPNFEAWAKFSQALQLDPQWVPLWQRLLSSEGSALPLGNIVAATLPGLDEEPVAGGTGPAASIFRSAEVAPGRGADAIAFATEVRGHLKRLGVRRQRFALTTFAGPNSNEFVSISEFENLAALGAFADASANDQGLQDLLRTTGPLSANSPIRPTSASIRVEFTGLPPS